MSEQTEIGGGVESEDRQNERRRERESQINI